MCFLFGFNQKYKRHLSFIFLVTECTACFVAVLSLSSGGTEVSVSHAYMSESYFTIISNSSVPWSVSLETLITHSDNSREVMAEFTICSYNIHHCYTDDGKHSFNQIVQTIQNLKPDILCLQVIICSQLCRQVRYFYSTYSGMFQS